MDIITWLIVGLVAGLAASTLIRGSGLGILGDIALGVVGAFVGGWTFHRMGWSAPFHGIAGVIAVAFVGAFIVLLAVRAVIAIGARR
jgi:uncharacterized membrane protein YeaQ/YmgE (transglycosylase-associated protein family)